MNSKLYSIRDKKIGFMNPFVQVNDEAAKRQISIMVNNPSLDTIHQYPDDFDLYRLGDFDNDSGVVSPCAVPEFICNASEVVKHD